MKTRQILLDIVCVLIASLAIFFFAGGFAWDMAEDFFGLPFDFIECILGLFIIISLLSALATCICRLLRIHFTPRDTERRIAVIYLCLAVLGIYPLMVVSVFNTLTFSPGDSQWLITRNTLSVLGMDLSVFWLAVLCAKLLVRTRQKTEMDQ
ncbi:MAG: hypothetical protein J6Q22_15730 [Prevotella sp.]|nr:hypothetical protein [Prevotella sp.]